MKQTPTNLIALFARGREIGYVMMEKGEIYRYGVKSIRGKREGPRFLRRVAKSLFSLLEIAGPEGAIVIERVDDPARHGQLAQAMVDVVKRSVEVAYLLMEVDLAKVKQRLCGSADATHDALISAAAQKYPISLPRAKGVKSHQARYWMPVLMALAMADFAKDRCRAAKGIGHAQGSQ